MEFNIEVKDGQCIMTPNEGSRSQFPFFPKSRKGAWAIIKYLGQNTKSMSEQEKQSAIQKLNALAGLIPETPVRGGFRFARNT